jgi:hypothetical protein
MADSFSLNKVKKTPTRKVSALPRFGIYFDIFGRRFTYKRAPLLETLFLLKDRGFSMANLMSVSIEQLDEIRFPSLKATPKIKKTTKKKKSQSA